MRSCATKLLSLAALLCLAGCAGPVSTTLANGQIAYRVDCDGNARGLNLCLEKAGKSCGADGYTLVSEEGLTLSTSDAIGNDPNTFYKDFAGDRNRIYFACGV